MSTRDEKAPLAERPFESGSGRDFSARWVSGSAPPEEEKEAGGTTIDLGPGSRYEVLRSLGRGGMAEVFLARRLGALGFTREVAVKCLTEDAPYEGERRMFLYEARLASLLHHPGIAEAYDLEEVGKKLYLVLEYVDGPSARALLSAAAAQGRPLPLDLSTYLAASIAEALAYAHALKGPDGEPLGIVHRDVTPSNVMVTLTGIPKLVDFGAAKARLTGRDRTKTGQVRGTFAYLSPEQASGHSVDGRSDLFSLGLVLVELATGKPVFEADSEVETAQVALDRDSRVREATRDLPPTLQRICRKALAFRPADRFQDGGEFARALRAYLSERGKVFGAAECARALSELTKVSLAAEELPGSPSPVSRGRSAWKVARKAGFLAAEAVLLALWGTHSRDLGGPARSLEVMSSLSAPTNEAPPPRPDTLERTVDRRGGRESPGVEAPALPGPLVVEDAPPVAAASSIPSGVVPVVPRKHSRKAPSKGHDEVPVETPPLPAEELVQRSVGPTEQEGRAVPGDHAEVASIDPRPRREPTARSAMVRFADRGMVSSAEATLPRGTLLPARLVAAIDVNRGGRVLATVTEDVPNGAAPIPKGSLVACRVEGVAGGRITLSCDAVKADTRAWSFTAIAVGKDERAGLEVTDAGVGAGTPFFVYVTAPAVVD